MKIQAVSNQNSIKRTRQNNQINKNLTGFKGTQTTVQSHIDNQKAGQVVLSGSGYDISYPMFKKV